MQTSDVVLAADRLKESRIQTCMSDHGFRYDKRPPNVAEATKLAKTQQLDNQLVENEWYGFRDSTNLFASPITPPDPNQARVDAMDETQRTAYLRALNISTSTEPSCASVGEAAAADAIAGPATQRLGVLYGDLLVRVKADTRVTEAQEAWRKCMLDLGYVYDSRDGIIAYLKGEAERINPAASSSDLATALEAVQSKAKALASADVGCDESAGLQRVTSQVRLAEEQQLFNSEGALFEEIAQERADLLQNGGSDGDRQGTVASSPESDQSS